MLEGFRCGIVPMRLANDDTLFVGGTNRGWAFTGGKPFSFERIRWTGKVPFEMLDMKALPEGFELNFTKPVDKKIVDNPVNYVCSAWTYIYRDEYDSPEMDKLKPSVVKAVVADDGMSVRFTLDKMTKDHIHHINCSKIMSNKQMNLWHPDVYYTLNELPKK